jgi:hypothetical protein
MPGFATSTRTLEQAKRLMAAVRCSAQEIDIRPSCQQMLADIGHPYARGEPVYDIAFENVQAGERTSHLFRLANFHNGSSSAPATSASSRSAGAPTASATTCRTTTSTRACRRR